MSSWAAVSILCAIGAGVSWAVAVWRMDGLDETKPIDPILDKALTYFLIFCVCGVGFALAWAVS